MSDVTLVSEVVNSNVDGHFFGTFFSQSLLNISLIVIRFLGSGVRHFRTRVLHSGRGKQDVMSSTHKSAPKKYIYMAPRAQGTEE